MCFLEDRERSIKKERSGGGGEEREKGGGGGEGDIKVKQERVKEHKSSRKSFFALHSWKKMPSEKFKYKRYYYSEVQ